MAKTKYAVTHAGQTFTRTTDRTYTHVILGKPSYEAHRGYALRRADDRTCQANYDYHCRESGPNPQFQHHAPQDLARSARIAAMTREQWAAEELAKAEDDISVRQGRGEFTFYVAITWCGRPDLAAKEVAKAMKGGWYTEVLAIPTEG